MNTIYSAVSARTREIATLRAIGFGAIRSSSQRPTKRSAQLRRRHAWRAAPRGAVDGYQTATMNFQSFSQIAFAFAVTPELLFRGTGLRRDDGALEGRCRRSAPPAFPSSRRFDSSNARCPQRRGTGPSTVLQHLGSRSFTNSYKDRVIPQSFCMNFRRARAGRYTFRCQLCPSSGRCGLRTVQLTQSWITTYPPLSTGDAPNFRAESARGTTVAFKAAHSKTKQSVQESK